MIKVDNLTKEFKMNKKYPGFSGAIKSFFSKEYTVKRAVDNMSFQINDGEIVGYIGSNGAGKSTTIKMMTGILTPTSGQIEVNGIIPYEERTKNAMNIGVVFGQRTQLWWDLPLSESFSLLRDIYGVTEEEYTERMKFFNDVLGIEEFILSPVRTLSLGQRMRADIAASLIHNPKILYLDEPTIGLDVVVKEKYGYMTTAVIQIKQNEEKSKAHINKYFNLSKEDLNIQFEEGKILVNFNKNKVSSTEVIQFYMNNYNLLDFSLKETSVDDIIKKIYRKEV